LVLVVVLALTAYAFQIAVARTDGADAVHSNVNRH
jgi:hypothetical protein